MLSILAGIMMLASLAGCVISANGYREFSREQRKHNEPLVEGTPTPRVWLLTSVGCGLAAVAFLWLGVMAYGL
jgi:hypothetical protein